MKKYMMIDSKGIEVPQKKILEMIRKEYKGLKTVYNDRMRQWDYDKYRSCVEEVFGPTMGDYLPENDDDKMSEFLSLYMGKSIKCCVMEYFEDARGYPLWRIDYQELDLLEVDSFNKNKYQEKR